jgi:hypothetical protein
MAQRGGVYCCLCDGRCFEAEEYLASVLYTCTCWYWLLYSTVHTMGTCNNYIICSLESRPLHGLVFLPVASSLENAHHPLRIATSCRHRGPRQQVLYTSTLGHCHAVPSKTINKVERKWSQTPPRPELMLNLIPGI